LPKVVFDTNIYISALLTPGGKAEEAYLRAIEGEIQLFTSVPILTEMALKLRNKFQWDDEKIKAAVRHISDVAIVCKPAKSITVLADAPDNRILECARDVGADFIVTGDKHLLKLGAFEGIAIVTLAEFLKTAD
jgi:putative PIN family toxin of toxin-antitoxin system